MTTTPAQHKQNLFKLQSLWNGLPDRIKPFQQTCLIRFAVREVLSHRELWNQFCWEQQSADKAKEQLDNRKAQQLAYNKQLAEEKDERVYKSGFINDGEQREFENA